MRYIAGIDIGNSSTEVALARQDETGALTITHSALAETTGIKFTTRWRLASAYSSACTASCCRLSR